MKIKIKIGKIGHLPFSLNWERIKKWESDVFEIIGEVEEYHFRENANTPSWGYSDSILEKELPKNTEADFFIGITYVPIEDNYYSRRLSSNRIVLSYFEIYNILMQEHIPIENFVLREIYGYILIYLRNNKKIPIQSEPVGFHDDDRGCIFDMNGNKANIVFSLDRPKICDECAEKIRTDRVSDTYIKRIKKEILRIRKERFYQIITFIKAEPILSIIISALFGISLNLIATWIYDFLKVSIK